MVLGGMEDRDCITAGRVDFCEFVGQKLPVIGHM